MALHNKHGHNKKLKLYKHGTAPKKIKDLDGFVSRTLWSLECQDPTGEFFDDIIQEDKDEHLDIRYEFLVKSKRKDG